MKKYVDGKYIEMTADEIKNLPEDDTVIVEPTLIERVEAIEAVLLEGVLSGDQVFGDTDKTWQNFRR